MASGRGPVARERLLWRPMKGLHGAPQQNPCFPAAMNVYMAFGHRCVVRCLGNCSCEADDGPS